MTELVVQGFVYGLVSLWLAAPLAASFWLGRRYERRKIARHFAENVGELLQEGEGFPRTRRRRP